MLVALSYSCGTSSPAVLTRTQLHCFQYLICQVFTSFNNNCVISKSMSRNLHGSVILTSTLKMGVLLAVISFIVVFIPLFCVCSHLSLYDHEYVLAPKMLGIFLYIPALHHGLSHGKDKLSMGLRWIIVPFAIDMYLPMQNKYLVPFARINTIWNVLALIRVNSVECKKHHIGTVSIVCQDCFHLILLKTTKCLFLKSSQLK